MPVLSSAAQHRGSRMAVGHVGLGHGFCPQCSPAASLQSLWDHSWQLQTDVETLQRSCFDSNRNARAGDIAVKQIVCSVLACSRHGFQAPRPCMYGPLPVESWKIDCSHLVALFSLNSSFERLSWDQVSCLDGAWLPRAAWRCSRG